MHQTNKKSVCLQPNTRSTKVTSRKEAKVSNQKRCICHVHQASMGFGQRARRWVSMMLQNTTATAAFNGWRSASFTELSGVQQGSPLSPLLYVLAAQPFASHIRHQTRQGVIRSITMPDGQPAPVSHQHADDTTIHVLQWTSRFFEIVIVASCNEYLSLPKKKKKKKSVAALRCSSGT